MSGGVISGATDSANASQTGGGNDVISSGGRAVDTVVTSEGLETVRSGATASATFVGIFGGEDVAAGGVVVGTVLSGIGRRPWPTSPKRQSSGWRSARRSAAEVSISSTAALQSARISSGGQLDIELGGVTTGTVIGPEGVEDVEEGTVSGTVVDAGGEEKIEAAFSGTIEGIPIATSGLALGTIVGNGGAAYVYGSANGAVVESGGLFELDGSGSATNLTLSSGSFYGIGGGALLSGVFHSAGVTLVIDGGTQFIESGTTQSGALIINAGVISLFGVTSDTDIGNGFELVESGGTAVGSVITTTVFPLGGGFEFISPGFQNIFSRGLASDTIVSGGGTESVFLDGVARDTVVSFGGEQNAFSGRHDHRHERYRWRASIRRWRDGQRHHSSCRRDHRAWRLCGRQLGWC